MNTDKARWTLYRGSLTLKYTVNKKMARSLVLKLVMFMNFSRARAFKQKTQRSEPSRRFGTGED